MAISEAVLSPANSVATSTPQGTPSMVPSSRCQPLVRVSPQELVPAKITNAAITAQYQREGETNSPVTMANDAATDTWMACRVVGRRPSSVASSGPAASDAGGGTLSAPCRARAFPAAAPSTIRTSAVAVAAVDDRQGQPAHGGFAGVVSRRRRWLPVEDPLRLARRLRKPAGLRYAN